MLLNLHKKTWMDGLTLAEYSEHSRLNENIVSEMLELAKNYNKVKHRYTVRESFARAITCTFNIFLS